jgi:flagellar basal-body rod protein FlgB
MFESVTEISGILGAISQRQSMVANNIANAHTPGYNAQHSSFSELLGRLGSPFETRLSAKMGSSVQLDAMGQAGDGEPVNLQKEMLDLQRNSMFYSMATRRLSTVITLLKSAPQVGR